MKAPVVNAAPDNASTGDARGAVAAGYGRLLRRRAVLLVALAAVAIVGFALDVMTGAAAISPSVIVQGLLDRASLEPARAFIIWDVRMPAAVVALLVGGALSLAGAEMQTVLNNPLASPFTLGVSAAATLGAALAIAVGSSLPFFGSSGAVSANAFVFALGSVFLLQLLASLRGSGPETLVLFGIALVFAFNALVGVIQFISSQEAIQQLVFWSLGSLSGASWSTVRLLLIAVVITFPFSYAARWKMTALGMGDERARSFGVAVRRLRFFSLVRVSFLAAASVAAVGTIGFVGLVGPHIARLMVGDDHRFLLPASLLSGAIVMSLASTLSKVLVPGAELPVGIVTSLVGVPTFLALILGGRGRR